MRSVIFTVPAGTGLKEEEEEEEEEDEATVTGTEDQISGFWMKRVINSAQRNGLRHC